MASDNQSVLDTVKQNQLKVKICEIDTLVSGYNLQINYCNRKIAEAEQAYNSLVNYKASVQSSQESFFSSKGSKATVVQQVKSISNNNTVAKKYSDGMERVLSGPGSRIANGLYSVLLQSVNDELNRLRNSISHYEQQINHYNSLIDDAQRTRSDTVNELEKMEES